MNKFLSILDSDSILYGCSTVLEDRYIIVTHIKSGREKEFRNITEFKGRGTIKIGGWLKELNDEKNLNFTPDDFNVEQKVRRNEVPVSKAEEHIISSVEAINSKEWCDELKIVIGGDKNYRKGITSTYKQNRPPKPIMYLKMREWFIKEYKDQIIIAEGCEADDVLSIYGYWGYQKCLKSGDYKDDNICMIHIDKDINQCVGFHFNYKSKKENPEWINEKQAAKSFWVQMMQGDSSDNIQGLKDIGKIKALTYLEGLNTIEQMEERVLYLYKDFYKDDWKKKFQLSYQLLKLQEKKDVIPKYKFKE